MYVPFTGLGLHNGFRGNNWLENRIEIFKQFVVPSLKHQTSQDFIIWISWRREEKNNPIVRQFISDLDISFGFGKVIHTFAGVCFYDDKYPDDVARDRLINSLHSSTRELFDAIGECDYILMTIQPSDDLYHQRAIESIQHVLKENKFNAVGFQKGYICNYNTKEAAEYNPTTNPPFYTIKFPREIFFDPLQHANFTALKKDVGKYLAGTPCPSHEYIGNCLRYAVVGDLRGFCVGTHGINISTTFSNPYKGDMVNSSILRNFGIYDVPALEIKTNLFKKILLKLPYKVQRKLRYIANEWKFFQLSTWSGLIK